MGGVMYMSNDAEDKVVENVTGYPSIDKPWLKFYEPKQLNYQMPECSIYEYMSACSKEYADLYALEYFGQKITYKKMHEIINKTAKALVAVGVKEREIVSVCLPNIPERISIEL